MRVLQELRQPANENLPSTQPGFNGQLRENVYMYAFLGAGLARKATFPGYLKIFSVYFKFSGEPWCNPS